MIATMLRFHTPLIEPDVPISGIRLSDSTLNTASVAENLVAWSL